MPMFRRMISRLFRQLPLVTINPDEVVARGAAVRAGLLAGGVGLEEHVLTDVAPFTLGVGVSNRTSGGLVEGLFLPLIERNTTIPVSRSHTLTTLFDNQEHIALRIYQGESRFVRDNAYLGEITAPMPRGPAGSEKVDVRFTYDDSGLLEVDLAVLSSGIQRNLVIEGNPGLLSKDEREKRLKQFEMLKIHPREEAVNAAVAARASRLYEESIGDTRLIVAEALDNFLGALQTQRGEEIEQARIALSHLMDRIEPQSPI